MPLGLIVMTTFAEWEAAMRFPTVQAAADALGVTRRHVHRLRNGKPPSATLRKLMDALAELKTRNIPWPPS